MDKSETGAILKHALSNFWDSIVYEWGSSDLEDQGGAVGGVVGLLISLPFFGAIVFGIVPNDIPNWAGFIMGIFTLCLWICLAMLLMFCVGVIGFLTGRFIWWCERKWDEAKESWEKLKESFHDSNSD